MIRPTVGRVVWFYPGNDDVHSSFQHNEDEEPLAAIITKVHNDHLINLAVFDAGGHHWPTGSVILVQDGEKKPGTRYATWMPYQIGQAKKEEEKK